MEWKIDEIGVLTDYWKRRLLILRRRITIIKSSKKLCWKN